MSDELEKEQQAINKKLEVAKLKATASVMQQAFEPVEEGIGELNNNLKNLLEFLNKKPETKTDPEYFDKELSAKVVAGIGALSILIQKLKPVDLSPIKEIADSINSRNADLIKSLIALSNVKNDTSAYDNLLRQTMAVIQKSNEYFAKGIEQFDTRPHLEKINLNLEKLADNVPIGWEFVSKKEGYAQLATTTKATPIFKTDKK